MWHKSKACNASQSIFPDTFNFRLTDNETTSYFSGGRQAVQGLK